MRLSVEKRLRAVNIYYDNQLRHTRGRFARLQVLAAQEGIVAEPNAFRNLINKYESTCSMCDATSEARAISHTKVTNQQLNELEKAVYTERGLAARRLRTRFALQVATQTYKDI